MERLRKNAEHIVRTLRRNGFEAYFAGGCVRDIIMGKKPEDYDIATSALPDDVRSLFDRTVPVGAKFGVVLVIIEGKKFEVATFRSDESYTDGRRPDNVVFTDEREDVLRRDFTINGLLYDPEKDEVLDYVEGRKDIEKGIIRSIGDPRRRFTEDRLRMLRAIRFSARLDFSLEEKTFAAIGEYASEITRVSWERIAEEIVKMITGANRGHALELLRDSGLLVHILPEVDAMTGVAQPEVFHPEGDVFEHTVLTLDELKDLNEVTALAALLHDVGKPETYSESDRIRFHNHDVVGAELADSILRRLKLSNEIREKVVYCVSNHMRFMHVREMRESKLKRLLRAETFDAELALHRADCLASHKNLEIYDFLKEKAETLPPEEIKPPPLITGDDLIDLGFTPGPIFTEVLASVEDMQLERKLNSRDQALEWVRENFGDRSGGG